jgi:hypothetical protein
MNRFTLQQAHLEFDLEQIEQELRSLNEAEQSTLYRVIALPEGYAKSQAIAEHWNATAAADELRRRRDRARRPTGGQ